MNSEHITRAISHLEAARERVEAAQAEGVALPEDMAGSITRMVDALIPLHDRGAARDELARRFGWDPGKLPPRKP